METQQDQVALPLRAHTILGVCEAIGEDLFCARSSCIGFAASVPEAEAGFCRSAGAGTQRRQRAARIGERRLILPAGLGARFEQVEQSTVLQQELLDAEGQGPSAGRSRRPLFDHRDD